MKRQIIKLVPVAVVALILTACGNGPNKTGRIYMPDMTYSNAYETYSEGSEQVHNGNYNVISARVPVAGTIPYDYIPDDTAIRKNPQRLMAYMIKNHFDHTDPNKWQEGFDRSGNEIRDPLPYTQENLDEGSRLYNINCAVCHGSGGEGNGSIVELPGGADGPFTSRPPNYKVRLPQVKDGNIFYVVSYGKNMMGGYGFQLSVKERWQVIHYIKNLAGMKGEGTVVASADTTARAKKK